MHRVITSASKHSNMSCQLLNMSKQAIIIIEPEYNIYQLSGQTGHNRTRDQFNIKIFKSVPKIQNAQLNLRKLHNIDNIILSNVVVGSFSKFITRN